jgi:hypothetical protein
MMGGRLLTLIASALGLERVEVAGAALLTLPAAAALLWMIWFRW